MRTFTLFTCLSTCFLINSASLIGNNCCHPTSADYVVVGVGTAGAVVTKKLSDDFRTSVIALHIGENLTENPLIKYSVGAFVTVPDLLVGDPFYITQDSTPQEDADDRQLACGISLPEGGASSVNAGVYCLGTNELYAEWEGIAGPNWSVNRIRRIFKELETFVGKTTDPAARGRYGPVEVRQIPRPARVSEVFTKAMVRATGIRRVLDYNVVNTGVSARIQYTQSGKGGKLRVSSATAFLNESVMTPEGFGVGGRKLRVLFNSTGLRTIWEGNRAVGVEFLQNGETKRVFAKKGVIVCCGLRSSPFLMHSGIGSKDLLDSLGIPVIFNNPNVGQNLTDQPGVRVVFTSDPRDYPNKFKGLFANIAALPLPEGDPNERVIRLASIYTAPGLGINLLTVDILRPKSRGFILIRSADPLVNPIIDLQILKQPEDLEVLRIAFQVYLKNLAQEIQRINPLYQLVYPDPKILDDPDLVDAFIKENIQSNQHFQSHCRIAPLEEGGVADSSGKVYGSENLYVADDSCVITPFDGSPYSCAMMIATNISELLSQKNREECQCFEN